MIKGKKGSEPKLSISPLTIKNDEIPSDTPTKFIPQKLSNDTKSEKEIASSIQIQQEKKSQIAIIEFDKENDDIDEDEENIIVFQDEVDKTKKVEKETISKDNSSYKQSQKNEISNKNDIKDSSKIYEFNSESKGNLENKSSNVSQPKRQNKDVSSNPFNFSLSSGLQEQQFNTHQILSQNDQNFDILEQKSANSMKFGNFSGKQNSNSYFQSQYPKLQNTFKIAFKKSILLTVKNPIIPFIILLIFLDTLTIDKENWIFLFFYLILLILAPTSLRAFLFQNELQIQWTYYNHPFKIYRKGQIQIVKRLDLLPGDILFIEQFKLIPTNSLVLKADEQMVAVTIDSSSLDNIPQFQVEVQLPTLQKIETLSGKIDYEILPFFDNDSKVTFIGAFDGIQQTVDIDKTQVVPSGSQIIDSQSAYLLVLPSDEKKFQIEELDLPDHFNFNMLYLYLILFSILLSLTLSILTVFWGQNENHKIYSQNENFLKMFSQYLNLYSTVVPIFLEIIRPLFSISGLAKVVRDKLLTGALRGVNDQNKFQSFLALENLCYTKFVNYDVEDIFIKKQTKVKGITLLNVERTEEEMEEENEGKRIVITEQTNDIDVAQKQLKHCLLGISDYELSEQEVAVQYFCKRFGFGQFAKKGGKKLVYRERKFYHHFHIEKVMRNQDNLLILYQVARELDVDEANSDDEEEIKKIYNKVLQEQYLNNGKKITHVLSIVCNDQYRCIQNHEIVKEEHEKKLIKGEKFVLFLELNKQQVKDLIKNDYSLTDEMEREISITSCIEFNDVNARNEIHLLLDLNLALIRQWFFTDKEMIEDLEEFTIFTQLLKHTKLVEYIEDEPEQLLEQIQQFKISINSLLIEKHHTLINQQVKIDDQYIVLIVSQKVAQIACSDENIRSKFLESLLYPSFVVFLNLEEKDKNVIMKFQADIVREQKSVRVFFGQRNKEIQYCDNKTIKVSLSNSIQSDFTETSHIRIVDSYILSKLILTHSRLINIRNQQFAVFQIYKSFLITQCEFFFAFFNGYSPQTLFAPSLHFMYHYLFTSIVSYFLFVTYMDVDHSIIKKFGFDIIKCQQNFYYNFNRIVMVFLDSIYQGFIIFYIPSSVLQYANNYSGIVEGFYYISLVVYLILISTVTAQPFILMINISQMQMAIYVVNLIFVLLILNLTCSSSNIATSIPQYVNHLPIILDDLKSLFIIVIISSTVLSPTLILTQYFNIVNRKSVYLLYKDKMKEIDDREYEEQKSKSKNEKERRKHRKQRKSEEQQYLKEKQQQDSQFDTKV